MIAGSFGEGSLFCELSAEAELLRPSGLCFDAKGRLLVTSMSGQVNPTTLKEGDKPFKFACDPSKSF